MPPRSRTIWAFQANPEKYDIVRAVRELRTDAWTIGKSAVRRGDLALIWKAKGREKQRGIVAFGLVVSDPFVSDDVGNPLWKTSEKQGPARRVLIRYIVPEDAPFWASAHPWLETLNVAKGQMTVFRVSLAEWQRATALVSSGDVRQWLEYDLPPEGKDWVPAEMEIAVRAYLDLQARQRRGELVVKQQVYRALREAMPNRTESSFEWRFQNISHVLQEHGLKWIPGLEPAANTGDLLPEIVRSVLHEDRKALKEVPPPIRSLPAPPAHEGRRRARKPVFVDFALLAEAKRETGRRGEELIVAHERRRLLEAGRADLAARVEHVAVTQGDGLGYDVRSYDLEGRELLIEVKSTGGNDTSFFLSVNELETSRKNPETFRIYRVVNLDSDPTFYAILPPVEKTHVLDPVVFRVSPIR